MKIDLHKNFGEVIRELEQRGERVTNIALELGYTSTSLINSIVNGDKLPSIKIILKMVERYEVDPAYLFFGEGRMFLFKGLGLDQLRKENEELRKNYSALSQMHSKLTESFMTIVQSLDSAEKRYAEQVQVTNKVLDKISDLNIKTESIDKSDKLNIKGQ
jgi:transcriptional regulator with XRE-family HTH domain